MRRLKCTIASLALAGSAAPAIDACAQSISSSVATFTHGYSASAGEFSAPVNPTSRDSSGNQVIVDGVMQNGSPNSLFSQRTTTGVGSVNSGVGQLGVNTAIGNNITVITQGSNNTIIINATQTNNGAVSAGTVLNGQINLNNGN